jgi:integrase
MPKLTKRTIDALKPGQKDYLIFDDEIPRFGVRVMPSGAKSYLIQYRADGHTRRYTFGKHGPLTPDEARSEAWQLLAAVDRGGDPSLARQERRAAPNITELCARFLAEYVPDRCKPSTQREYRRCVKLFIIPRIGTMKAADVQRRHVAELQHQLRSIPYQANRTLGVLSKLFNLAEVWGLRPDGSNPCRHVAKYKEVKRERFLSPAEMARLGQALARGVETGTETIYAVAAFQLLALTGCRLGEIQTLKWDYVQGSLLILPDSKTGAKRVPLGQAAMNVLNGLPRQPGNPYVIAGKLPASYLADLERPWRRIRARAGLSDVRIHDLRHSFASSAVGLGESLPVIGKLLGHNQVQTTARYAHLAPDPVHSAADRIASKISLYMGIERADELPPWDVANSAPGQKP